MSRENLVKDCKIIQIDNGHAAGQGTYTTAPIDTEGFDGVALIYLLGTVTAGSVLTLTALGCQTSGGAYSEISAQQAQATAGGANSNQFMVVDTLFPGGSKGYRYVEGQLQIATANAQVLGAVAILYEAKSKPIMPDASQLAALFGLGS